jgi:hypothetical protein
LGFHFPRRFRDERVFVCWVGEGVDHDDGDVVLVIFLLLMRLTPKASVGRDVYPALERGPPGVGSVLSDCTPYSAVISLS